MYQSKTEFSRTTEEIFVSLEKFSYKSMSLTLTSLLTIYIKSMLPQTLFEWEVPFGVQICGIMGLGLLYAGSGDRYISDILLAEIGKLPVRYGKYLENQSFHRYV